MVKTNGGKNSRLGLKFIKEMEEIKLKRITLKKDKPNKPISIEKITNLIVRHSSWPTISKKIIEADKEEVDKFGI